jgi:hypothetical protein
MPATAPTRDGAGTCHLRRVGRQAQMTKMILAEVVSAQIGRPKNDGSARRRPRTNSNVEPDKSRRYAGSV